MYSYSKGKYRSTQKEVNPFGVQFSLHAQATTVSERPGFKQSSDFRLARDQPDYTSGSVPGRRHSHNQSLSAEGGRHDRHTSASFSDHRSAPKHRQVHHPATAYATQLTDLAQPEPISLYHRNSPRGDDSPYAQTNLRQVHSAGPFKSRSSGKSTSHIPGINVEEGTVVSRGHQNCAHHKGVKPKETSYSVVEFDPPMFLVEPTACSLSVTVSPDEQQEHRSPHLRSVSPKCYVHRSPVYPEEPQERQSQHLSTSKCHLRRLTVTPETPIECQFQSLDSVSPKSHPHHLTVTPEDPQGHQSQRLHSANPKCRLHRIPGDKIMFAESPSYPGIPIVYRTPEERAANPDRLNLDRRRLTICPLLEGEDHLRLLNFQHNSIHKIEHLSNLKRLIFLDLYDNQIEEISGLGALKSLRVLMLGKNRIRKIENLNTLSKLDVLDLHGNQITKIENLSHLEELRVLNLAGNDIAHVNNLSGMDSLTELNLRRNKIMTVSDADCLPSLQRLFLSFNNITCFDDVSCISDSPSLSEVSLDGNPFSQDPFYRQTVLKHTQQLRQLDMKRITEEERRVSSLMVRKEEEKKKETNKIALLKEKRRLAINNAARQWEASKSMAMAKTSRLQPGPLGRQQSTGQSTPELQDSRPGSGRSIADSYRSQSFDLIRDKSGDSSRNSNLSDSPQKSKPPTPDLLANISNDVCHLAELEGDTLHLYGPGSLESLDKSWGVQAAGSVTTVAFKFIDFDEISKHLHKIRIRFPNVSTVQLGECNLSSLQQLNALSVLRRLDNISVATEGNPITSFSLWKQYLLFRLSHLSIKKINDEQVKPTDSHRAEKLFSPLADSITSELDSSRLLTLLGDSKRRGTQGLTEQELKAKKQLVTEGNVKAENVGRAGLVYYPGKVLRELLQGQTSQTIFARSYVRDLTTDAIHLDEKLTALDRLWPLMFIEMVQDAVLQMQDWDAYMTNVLNKLEKRK